MVSRYDATTGELIPITQRIGLLDRKLRIVSKNTETSGEWLKAAQTAFMSTYGYEWQGDNLVLARENLLYTFINNYKVIIPKSNGTRELGEIFSTPVIGEPMQGITQSFISFGKFDVLDEAKVALKYICTKFVRAMLGVLKVTQDNNTEVWKYVPLQDFTENSDIDWSKSIAEIDAQLYAKYKLTDEEINFIESMIKPME